MQVGQGSVAELEKDSVGVAILVKLAMPKWPAYTQTLPRSSTQLDVEICWRTDGSYLYKIDDVTERLHYIFMFAKHSIEWIEK